MDDRRRVIFTSTPPDPARTTFSLLAVPPSLAKVLSSPETASKLEIRGHASDAAVLVTPTETFSIRGVQNSNSLLLCSTGFRYSGSEEGVDGDGREDPRRKRRKGEPEPIVIETTLHETLEVVPGVARTDKLAGFLRGTEYEGEDAEEGKDASKFVSLERLQTLLPACDAAIEKALNAHRVVAHKGHLRPIPTSYLLKILPPLLASLTAPPPPPKKKKKDDATASAPPPTVDVDLDELVMTLDSLDCSEMVAKEILSWYGKPKKPDEPQKVWEVRVEQLVREIGIAWLASGGYGEQALKPFEASWAGLSHSFAHLCNLSLISGSYIITPNMPPGIKYYPVSRLSPDATVRFDELFGEKDRWEEAEMTLFIDDLVGGDKKKREALVLKFVRKVKDEKSGKMTEEQCHGAHSIKGLRSSGLAVGSNGVQKDERGTSTSALSQIRLCSACVNPPEWSDSKHAFTSYIPTSLLSAFTTFRNLTTFHLSGCTIPDIPFVQLLGPFGSHRSQITSVTLHHCCIFYAALVWVFGIVPLACDAAPIYLLPDADMECDWDSLEDKPILLQLLDDIGAPNVMRELRFQDQENAVMRVAFADYGVFRLFHWFFFELGDPEKFKITTPPFNPFSSLVHLDFEAPMSDPIGLDNAMDGALHLPSYMPHWLMEPMKRELREEWAPLGMREYYGPQLDILDLKELKMGLLF
ncbi:hypothetical protein T439DRAFT_357854 [Meredithblackwellia eburnea MCA 4105]